MLDDSIGGVQLERWIYELAELGIPTKSELGLTLNGSLKLERVIDFVKQHNINFKAIDQVNLPPTYKPLEALRYVMTHPATDLAFGYRFNLEDIEKLKRLADHPTLPSVVVLRIVEQICCLENGHVVYPAGQAHEYGFSLRVIPPSTWQSFEYDPTDLAVCEVNLRLYVKKKLNEHPSSA